MQNNKEIYFSGNEGSLSIKSSSPNLKSILEMNKATEADDLQYLAGWIAFKLKQSHPDLGQHTYKTQIDHCYGMTSWVSHLSFSGPMQPLKWEEQAHILNKLFMRFHKSGKIKKGPRITQKLVKMVEHKYKQIDLDAARLVS